MRSLLLECWWWCEMQSFLILGGRDHCFSASLASPSYTPIVLWSFLSTTSLWGLGAAAMISLIFLIWASALCVLTPTCHLSTFQQTPHWFCCTATLWIMEPNWGCTIIRSQIGTSIAEPETVHKTPERWPGDMYKPGQAPSFTEFTQTVVNWDVWPP